jgi:hypothetical protein
VLAPYERILRILVAAAAAAVVAVVVVVVVVVKGKTIPVTGRRGSHVF